MSEKILTIKHGIYRIECINHEVTNINFEILVYYDKTDELIGKKWVHGLTPIVTSEINRTYQKDWELFTLENDITINYCVNYKATLGPAINTNENLFSNKMCHIEVDSINLLVDVQTPNSLDRSLLLTFDDVRAITEKYYNYKIGRRLKCELTRDHGELERAIKSLRVTCNISPMIVTDTVLNDLIRRLTYIKGKMEDRIYKLICEYETTIKDTRDRFAEDGVNPGIVYSEGSSVDFMDRSSASYIAWEQHGFSGISATKLG